MKTAPLSSNNVPLIPATSGVRPSHSTPPAPVSDMYIAATREDHFNLRSRINAGIARTLAPAPEHIPLTATPSVFSPHLAGAELFAAIKVESRKNFQPRNYDAAKSALFSTIDNVMVDGVRGVYCAYSGVFVPGTSDNGGDYRERGDQNRDGRRDSKGMNVEHLWPQSLFDEKEPMKADAHHLLPTFMFPNNMRGNLPFGEVTDHEADYTTEAGAQRDENTRFEPPDAVKGQIARSLFYFFTNYDGRNKILPGNSRKSFWIDSLETLLQWNEKYPPDTWEHERNGRVEKFQGNRNPFIDDHTLIRRIGLENFRQVSTSASTHGNEERSRQRRRGTR